MKYRANVGTGRPAELAGALIFLASVMNVSRGIHRAAAIFAVLTGLSAGAFAQQPMPDVPQPTFRAGVDLVTIRALVRDGRGRPVTNLKPEEFELFDAGQATQIKAVEQDRGPVGLAVLFDVSGSMDLSQRFARAREAGYFLLSGLRSGEDEAAIFAFDSRLHMVQPFTTELDRLRGSISGFTPWGMTSLHDAIATASRTMDTRATRRRALVVLTDGIDTGSRLGAPEVSRIASSIDLPVYIIAVVSAIDDPRDAGGEGQGVLEGELADLARWTGGAMFAATTTAEASLVARKIVEELRQQYLIAFEPGKEPGWHPVEVRVRRKGHTVRARSGYLTDRTEPVS